MEKKVVQLEIGKVFAVIIAIVAVAFIATMVLQGDYFKGELVTDKEALTTGDVIVVTDVKATEALTVLGSEAMTQMYIHGKDLMKGQTEVVHGFAQEFEKDLLNFGYDDKLILKFRETVTGYDNAIANGEKHSVAIKDLMGFVRNFDIEDKAVVLAFEEMNAGIENGINNELINFSRLANNELMILAKNTAGLSREFDVLAKEITLTANKVLDFTYGMALTINTNVVADETELQFQTVGIQTLPYDVERIEILQYDVIYDLNALDTKAIDGDYAISDAVIDGDYAISDAGSVITINDINAGSVITTDDINVGAESLDAESLDAESLDARYLDAESLDARYLDAESLTVEQEEVLK